VFGILSLFSRETGDNRESGYNMSEPAFEPGTSVIHPPPFY